MIKRDGKTITIVILFVVLGFLATIIAARLHFLPEDTDNPALLME